MRTTAARSELAQCVLQPMVFVHCFAQEWYYHLVVVVVVLVVLGAISLVVSLGAIHDCSY